MNLRLIFGIHRATHRIGLYIQSRAPDLNQAEAHILCHLVESGDCTIAELHRAFAHKRSTLTSVLDRLAARKLVTREISETDRRSFVIGLTASGRVKAAKIHRHLETLEAEALNDTGRKTIETVEQVVERIGRGVH
jgi:DNA-binding MarR family transcriptional regulator